MGIAQRLRGDPVLAIAAMQVAAQHAETEGARPRQNVEEGLLFYGVAMRRVDVAVGCVELSSAIEAHLADARETRRNGAPVAAGEALHPAAIERLVEFRFARLNGELLGQDPHG